MKQIWRGLKGHFRPSGGNSKCEWCYFRGNKNRNKLWKSTKVWEDICRLSAFDASRQINCAALFIFSHKNVCISSIDCLFFKICGNLWGKALKSVDIWKDNDKITCFTQHHQSADASYLPHAHLNSRKKEGKHNWGCNRQNFRIAPTGSFIKVRKSRI